MLMRPPIAVFGYARPAQLQRTILSLAECNGFDLHPLHLFLDGSKGSGDAERVAAVRRLANSLRWSNLVVHHAECNRGLRRSIMEGVSTLVAHYGRAIVIEDDLQLSPVALDYFTKSLDALEHEDRVKAICGYMYKLREPASGHRAFFLPFASSWGWATWKRAWTPFMAEEERLTAKADDGQFLREFDRQGIIAASTMLKCQKLGLIDSWAILWNAYLAETRGLALYPAETMVLNGGFADPSATHASMRNPINGILSAMSADRTFARTFQLPLQTQSDEVMRRRVARCGEARLHRISAHLGFLRRKLRLYSEFRSARSLLGKATQ